MYLIALRLPCLARCGEHGALAGAGKAHHHGDALRPGHILDRPPLFVRKPRPGDLPIPLGRVDFAALHLRGQTSRHARPDRSVLVLDR
jgi:hypothetical protein